MALVSQLIAAATLASFVLARGWGYDTPAAQTMAVNTLVVGQVAYLFNTRHLRETSIGRDMLTGNRTAWVCVAILTALQLVFVYLPFMNTWFAPAPIGLLGWLVPGAFAVLVFLLVEGAKVVLRRVEQAP